MSRTVRARVLLYLLSLFVCSFHGASSYALTDDCLKPDINNLEDYISKLNFENVPTINMMTGGFECPVTALPFGALKSDWTRLLLLQQAQTEGSILKEKLHLVYKVLIYAYYRMEERFDSKKADSTKENLENADKNYNASSLLPVTYQTIYSTSNNVDTEGDKTTEVFASSVATSELTNQNLGKDTSTEASYNNSVNNTRISSSPLHEYTISTGGDIPKVNDVISQTSTLNEWTESDATDWKQTTESNKELFSKKVELFNSNKSVEGNEVDSNFTITTTESISKVASNGDKGSRLISTDSYYNIASPPVQSDAEGTSTTAESPESSQVITFFSTSDSSGFPTSGDQQIVTMHNSQSTSQFYSREQTTEPEIEVKHFTEIAEETSKSSDTFGRFISDNDIRSTMQIVKIDENSTISSVSLKPTRVNSSTIVDVNSAKKFTNEVEKANGTSDTFERLTSNNDVETTMQTVDIQKDSTIPPICLEPNRTTSSTSTETTTGENYVNPVNNNDVETTMQTVDVQKDSTSPSISLEPNRTTSSTSTETTIDENHVNPVNNNDVETTMQTVDVQKDPTIPPISLEPNRMTSSTSTETTIDENHVNPVNNNDVETTMQTVDVQKDSTILPISLEPNRMTSSTSTETTTDENHVNPVKPIDNRVVSCINNFHRDKPAHRTNNVYQTFKHDSIPRNLTYGSFYRNIIKDRALFNKPPTRNDLWKYIVITHSVSSTAAPISKSVSNQMEETEKFTKNPSSFRKRGSLNTSVEKTFQWFYSVHRGNKEQGGNDPVDERGTNIECNSGK